MDLSTKQLNEIECLDYFALANCDYKDNTVEDGISAEEAYFQITNSGVKKVKTNNGDRLRKLLDTKKWRLRFMDMYEQGILEGSVPLYTLLGFEDNNIVPKCVMEFMAKTLFKGKDMIISFYNDNI